MKFTVIEPGGFLHGATRYENGNTHDSDNITDMTDGDVMRFHRAGWVSLEGKADVPRSIHHTEVAVDNSSQSSATKDI